jgi:hypothetical protein
MTTTENTALQAVEHPTSQGLGAVPRVDLPVTHRMVQPFSASCFDCLGFIQES